MRLSVCLFVILSFAFATQGSDEFEQLHITVTIDKSYTDFGERIIIDGKIRDDSGKGISQAEISIQVDGPRGGTVHIRFMLSDLNGEFSDDFILQSEALRGNYTIHITALKTGYNQVYKNFSFHLGTETESAIPIINYLLPFGIIAIAIIILIIILRRRKRKVELPEPSDDMDYIAVARASARLEKLRVQKKIDEESYQRLRKEYERRLKEFTDKS